MERIKCILLGGGIGCIDLLAIGRAIQQFGKDHPCTEQCKNIVKWSAQVALGVIIGTVLALCFPECEIAMAAAEGGLADGIAGGVLEEIAVGATEGILEEAAAGAGEAILEGVGESVLEGVSEGALEGVGEGLGESVGEVSELEEFSICNCFPAGTLIETENGDKPIEEIAVGDRVWAQNLETGKPELRTVTDLFQKEADGLLTISVGDRTVNVTPQHPFWVPGKGWVNAGDLTVGDHLLHKDGSEEAITGITYESGAVTVYNFTVKGDHNYFVADVDVLVHNCDLESLAKSGRGLDIADKGGKLTRAGREFVKHMGEGPIPKINGSPATFNEAGQTLLEDILTDPASFVRAASRGRFSSGFDVVSPTARMVARFDQMGVFRYFGVLK